MSEPYVVVIGAANMDLHAIAVSTPIPGTSNIGSSELSPGGVGRNIAEVIARLGTRVHLVSVVGDDPLGAELLHHTAEAGVDVSLVREREVRTGTYAAIVAPDGQLVVGVSDMAAADLISPLMVEAAASLIRGALLLVLDGNLLPATVEQALAIAESCDVRVVLAPVSVPKLQRLRGVLGPRIDLIHPNGAELAAVTGMPTGTKEEVEAAVDRLLDTGVQAVWVRLGPERESFLVSPGGRWWVPPPRIEADHVDMAGTGDTMLGAFAHARIHGEDTLAAVHYGLAAAGLTLTSRFTIRTDLNDALIRSAL